MQNLAVNDQNEVVTGRGSVCKKSEAGFIDFGIKRRVKYWEAVLIQRHCGSGELCEMRIKVSINLQKRICQG